MKYFVAFLFLFTTVTAVAGYDIKEVESKIKERLTNDGVDFQKLKLKKSKSPKALLHGAWIGAMVSGDNEVYKAEFYVNSGKLVMKLKCMLNYNENMAVEMTLYDCKTKKPSSLSWDREKN